jgi:parallel beta-helix repeat protein
VPTRTLTLLATVALGLAGVVAAAPTSAGAAQRATARAAAAAPKAVTPNSGHTYVVTPTGVGMQNLSALLTHVVQAGDTVELADGVYRTGNLNVSAPGVTIRAQHMPSANGAAPSVWLDGSVPYQFWTQGEGNLWVHSYNKDFCAQTLRNLPCDQLSVSYHGDQLFVSGQPIPQTLHSSDLLSTTQRWFYVSSNHTVVTNFDPGTTAEMTDQETALMFQRSAVGSSLQGIGVRRYAGNDHDSSLLASHQDSAVYVNDASNVTFNLDVFSFNSVRGLKTQGDVPASQTPVAGAGVLVINSVFDHNGELALDSVDSDNITVAYTLFYRNNWEQFVIEQGAAKFLSLHNATVVNNRFIENFGIGLWFDRSAYNAYIAHNQFIKNQWHGIMFEISAKATITGNSFIANGHIGVFIYDAGYISLSHNLVQGNLEGFRIQNGHRTLANFPSGRDSDPDRKMPSAITFDVAAIDIHENGFYYSPAVSNGAVCDTNPSAQPTTAEPDPFSGCQYMIAGEDSATGLQPNQMGIKATHDNFHTRDWPAGPVPGVVPVFTALWETNATVYSASGCEPPPPGPSVQYRWNSLGEFLCTGQEPGDRAMF